MNHRSSTTTATTVVTALAALLSLALLVASPALAANPAGVVNINDASESQLALLPRVGPALAARIVGFRDENGPFKQPEDLILVPGIGDKTFERMAPYIVVEGKTTLSEKVRMTSTSGGGGR